MSDDMKKKLILLTLIVFLTGCDVKYNLTIDEHTFDEDIKFLVPTTTEYQNLVSRMANLNQVAYSDANSQNKQYYDLTVGEENNQLSLDYKYSYKRNDLDRSSAINQCYFDKTIEKTSEYIKISTANEFNCLYRNESQVIDQVEINITTKLEVEENNADKVSNNTYTWYVNNSNYQDKSIQMMIKMPRESIFQNSYFQIIALVGFVAIVSLLVAIIVNIKKKKNNAL